MKLWGKYVLLLTSAQWLLGTTTFAYVRPDEATRNHLSSSFPVKQRVVRVETQAAPTPSSLSAKAQEIQVRTDTLSGRARVLTGRFALPRLSVGAGEQAFVQAALNYVEQNAAVFGFNSSDLRLDPAASLITSDEQFIQFHVYRSGLRITDASVTFRFKHGTLVQLINHSFAEAATPSELTAARDLSALVAERTNASSVEAQGSVWRVEANAAEATYRLVKVDSYIVTTEAGPLTAEIDPSTQELFEVRANHHYYDMDVKGDSYARWYNEELQTFKLKHIAVDTDQGPVYPALAGPEPLLDGLKGHYVSISNVTGAAIKQKAELVDGRWLIHVKSPGKEAAWLDKTVAQLMVYSHTDLINRKAKQYISHAWLEEPLTARTNLDSNCNAHWDGSTINLYSGSSQCANTGLIADVIYHEWGHGLDAKTGGIDDGAFSEGFGDILALIFTRSPLLGIGFELKDHAPVRDLEPDRKYPDDQGEVHDEGLIIASTFWDLFKALRDLYDEERASDMIAEYAFKMIFTAKTYLEVYEAIKVIDDNDADLTNGTPHLCLINETFAKHGLTERDTNCKLAAIDSYTIDDSDHDHVIEPGETITLHALARNHASAPISGLGGTLSIANGAGVQVSDATLSWEAIPAQASQLSAKGAQLVVAEDAVCGSNFTTKLLLAANGATASLLQSFTIGKNAALPQSFQATGLPLPIEDRATVTSQLEVSGEQWDEAAPVNVAELAFSIRHSFVGDLTVRLMSPSGKAFEVYRGRGSSDDVTYQADISPLLQGEAGAGVWTLAVQDKGRRDSGFLDSFKLTLTPSRYLCD